MWMLPRNACGPMGLINSTVGDVLDFAKLHLDVGKTQDGTQLVSNENITAMREPQVESPDRYTLGKHWGLGVILFEWDGRAVYGHDGGTIGESSRLRIVPDANLAIALCANGGAGNRRPTRSCSASWWPRLAGVDAWSAAGPCRSARCRSVEIRRVRYERLSVRYDLTPEEGRLVGTVTLSGPIADISPDPVSKVTLTVVDGETFLAQDDESETPMPAVFYDFHDGVPQYLHHGARANPRVAD